MKLVIETMNSSNVYFFHKSRFLGIFSSITITQVLLAIVQFCIGNIHCHFYHVYTCLV